MLQVRYDAVHAVALTTTGTTSLMHEAKVDIVTVLNLSEHLSSASTTAQLSARFAYAAAMKSLNNLLLIGDGESWSRQRIDFAGLPEMVRAVELIASSNDPQGLKMARDAAKAAGLDRRQQRIFHDAITGQGTADYQELLSISAAR